MEEGLNVAMGKMNLCGKSVDKRPESSLKELFLINKSTYHALLSKVTPLEKVEIDRLNSQTLLPSSSEYDSPAPTSMSQLSHHVPNSFPSPKIPQRERVDLKGVSTSVPNNVENSANSHTFPSPKLQQKKRIDSNTTQNHEAKKDVNDVLGGVSPEEEEECQNQTQESYDVNDNSSKDHVLDAESYTLEANSKKTHKQPHLVSLKSLPAVLVTHKDNDGIPSNLCNESKERIGHENESKNNEQFVDKVESHNRKESEADEIAHNHDDTKSKRKQCPVCFDWYSNSFSMLRHLTSFHPESEPAKNAWKSKTEKETKNRNKIRLKMNDAKAKSSSDPSKSESAASVTSAAIASAPLKRRLKRARSPENDESENDTEEPVKSTKIEEKTNILKSKRTRSKKTVTKSSPNPKNTQPTRSSPRITGVKRPIKPSNVSPRGKKRKALGVKRKLTQVKRTTLKKPRVSSNKKPRIEITDDDDDSEYEDWT